MITWNGPAIKPVETVTINIRGENKNLRAFTKESNTNSIFLRAGELSEDIIGNVTLILTRSVEPDLNEATPEGGSLLIEYISTEYSAVVEE